MYTFSKGERLCSQKLIDTVFQQGERLMVFPFSVRWMVIPEGDTVPFESHAQVLIVAPKRKLRHAVDRNRTKRLMRECYRLQKPELYQFLEENRLRLILSLSYMHNEVFPYSVLYPKSAKMLTKLKQEILKKCSSSCEENDNKE